MGSEGVGLGFALFSLGSPSLEPNMKKKGTLSFKGSLGNLV